MLKQKIIDAILSRDTLALRRITGKFDGVPVLAYIDDDGVLKTFDLKVNPLHLEVPSTLDEWISFLTRYNVLHLSSMDEVKEFVASGKQMPQHKDQGIPVWAWLVRDGIENIKRLTD